MVTSSGKDGLRFRTVSGQNCLFHLTKSRGCLCISLRKEYKVFSYKQAVFLGVPIACAVMLINSTFVPVYIAVSLVIILIFILYQLMFPVIEERILLVKELGYQISTKMFTRNTTTTFIPYERVQRILINEVILRHRIIYILSLIVQDDKNNHKLIPLFADTLPRLDCLELIYGTIKHFEDS